MTRPAILSSLLLAYAVVAYGNGNGLSAQYFSDSSSGEHFQGSPLLSNIATSVNFNFINAPVPGLTRTTQFSAKWTGSIQPLYSEKYTFLTYSDDGVRVYINGDLLIDNWTSHAVSWNSNSVDLQAGHFYNIEIEYFQGTGSAILQLWWQSPSQSRQIVPQSQLYSASAPRTGSTYYVSPSGSDGNSGLSASQPWQTVTRVNQQLFGPGDRILFQCGGRYAGSLQPEGSGIEGQPITISSYGTGAKPIIDGRGQDSAVKLFNQEYWQINSLDITGSQHYGVFITGDASYTTLHYFRLSNLDVHDANGPGRWDSGLVMIAPIGNHLTFDDVLVDGVSAHNTNLWYGIHVGFNLYYSYPTNPPMSTNITVRNSHVHDVYGDGITVAQSHNVLIEKNVAYQTGLAPAGISYTPNAIWSWQCDQTLVQYNEGYSSHSYSYDGGVFDIDWGSTNTIVQYNYAHNADGYCVAIMGGHNVVTSNSIVRFNICSNNARKSGMAARQGDIYITTFGGGSLNGFQIYNNTAYWNPASDGGWIKGRYLALSGTLPRFIQNNILYSATPTLIDMDGSIPLNHNLYWNTTGASIWKYGSVSANTFGAFRQSTGQEANGLYTDPKLNSWTYSGVGRPASAFTLTQNSPALGSGGTWSGMGSVDFFGDNLPGTGTPDIGADYFDPAGSRLPADVWVNVISKNSGKCLDVVGSSTTAGANTQQWACWGGTNQQFLFTAVPGGYKVTARNSGLQLAVAGGPAATANGARIVQWRYSGGTNEIWKLTPTTDGYFSIAALNSGKCLDVSGISLNDGAGIQQWACWGGDNQKWQIVAVQ